MRGSKAAPFNLFITRGSAFFSKSLPGGGAAFCCVEVVNERDRGHCSCCISESRGECRLTEELREHCMRMATARSWHGVVSFIAMAQQSPQHRRLRFCTE